MSTSWFPNSDSRPLPNEERVLENEERLLIVFQRDDKESETPEVDEEIML